MDRRCVTMSKRLHELLPKSFDIATTHYIERISSLLKGCVFGTSDCSFSTNGKQIGLPNSDLKSHVFLSPPNSNVLYRSRLCSILSTTGSILLKLNYRHSLPIARQKTVPASTAVSALSSNLERSLVFTCEMRLSMSFNSHRRLSLLHV